MKRLSSVEKARELAGGIGDFIRYWGFRRIHGEIWTLVYLSRAPISGTEIVDLLGVSKALVSPALKELEDEGLIVRAASENEKVKRYSPVEDVVAVIKGVLKRRESPLLEKIWESHQTMANSAIGDLGFRLDRLEKMGEMIQMAQIGLQTLIDFEGLSDGEKPS